MIQSAPQTTPPTKKINFAFVAPAKERLTKYILHFVLVILLINLVILDIFLFRDRQLEKGSEYLQLRSFLAEQTKTCSAQCVDEVRKTTALTSSAFPSSSESASLTPTPTPSPTLTPTPTETPLPTVKEFFIPLGSGFGNAADWTTITGVGAKIDIANYGQVEKVYFEATVRIPTGNQTVYVRLYNANTFQSIANSEISLSGGTVTILTSQPISLPSGNNLYQIQMKTQLQYLTYIDQARIRIQTK